MTHDASIAGVIEDPRTLDLAREWLVKGGVVVLPTDTLYGFSAKLSAEDAIRRISALKHSAAERCEDELDEDHAEQGDYVLAHRATTPRSRPSRQERIAQCSPSPYGSRLAVVRRARPSRRSLGRGLRVARLRVRHP